MEKPKYLQASRLQKQGEIKREREKNIGSQNKYNLMIFPNRLKYERTLGNRRISEILSSAAYECTKVRLGLGLNPLAFPIT